MRLNYIIRVCSKIPNTLLIQNPNKVLDIAYIPMRNFNKLVIFDNSKNIKNC